MESRARRFRFMFWIVVSLGSLPSLVSGLILLGHFRIGNLCAEERSSASLNMLRAITRWERLHDWGRVGAMIAGLLVIAYATAWAFETRKMRALVAVLTGGMLLPALAITLWTGRVTPWHALEPPVSVGESQVVRAPEEWGGPQYCLQHLEEVRRLRLVYFGHIAGGLLVVMLSLGLADLGARWRGAKDLTASASGENPADRRD